MKLATPIAATALVLAGVAIGAACSAGASGPHGDRGTSITEITLTDGTRCAVMDKSGGAALSCGWKQP